MIKDLFINNYRGLKQLELRNLNCINIFVGPNNCGKTSILESIILSGYFDDVDLLVNSLISRYHRFSPEYFESLFTIEQAPIICLKSQLYENDKLLHTHLTYEKTQLIGKDDSTTLSNIFDLQFQYGYNKTEINNNDHFTVRFEENINGYAIKLKKYKDNSLTFDFPCKFISFSRFDNTEHFIKDIDKILNQNLRQELLDILKVFDNEIINFEIVGKNRIVKLFCKNHQAPLTLSDYGNGMYKAFFIATSALLAKDGILLVDEIEAGIHSKALSNFIEKLLNVCETNNVQLFLTTHSLEAIDIILDDCQDRLDKTAIYHIKNKPNATMAKRYSGTKLLNLRKFKKRDWI